MRYLQIIKRGISDILCIIYDFWLQVDEEDQFQQLQIEDIFSGTDVNARFQF